MTWALFPGGVNSSGGFTSSLVVTSATAVSVGDTICCAVTWDVGGGATGCSITDSLGNTYAASSASKNTGSLNSQAVQTLACVVTSAGTPTVTLKFTPTPGTTTASGVEFLVDVFTGSTSTGAIDGTGANNEQSAAGTGTDALTSGTWSTTNDGCLIYCATVDESTGGGTQSPGTGFALAQSDANVLVFNSEYGTQATHGSVAGTWTTNSGSDNFVTTALAVAPMSGGGGGSVGRLIGGTLVGGILLSRI